MNYNVRYSSQTEQSKEWLSLNVSGVKENVTITGLSPKTTYFFKVEAQSKTGSSEMSEVSMPVLTLPPLPSTPGQPQAVDISQKKIKITWDKPQENAEHVWSYTIYYKSLKRNSKIQHISTMNDEWTTVKTENAVEEFVVSELEVDTSYTFKVQAESVDGCSKESRISKAVQTLVPIPGKPGQPEAVSITHDRVELKWAKPTRYPEYVANYHISYSSQQEQSKEWRSFTVNGVEDNFTVTGLLHTTTYLFKVQGANESGSSEISEVSEPICTLPPVPTKPGQPKFSDATHDKITITWAKSRENAEYIQSYTIYYKSLQKFDRHGWTTVKTENAVEALVISGLEINTSYVFKVQAESPYGSSKESETSIQLQTLVPIPSQPGQPQAVSVTHTSVSLNWAKPKQYSEYVMNYCVKCSAEGKQSKEWYSLQVTGTREHVVVNRLCPNTTYLFKVQAISKNGSSEMSEVSKPICTLIPIPSKPGQLEAVSVTHNNVSLKWTKPTQYAEYVMNYCVSYYPLEEQSKETLVSVGKECVTIGDLLPDTTYVFKVQAQNKTGSSEVNEISVRTSPPVPSQPGQPQAVNISHDKITIIWAKPQLHAKRVRHYTIHYKSLQKSSKQEWRTVKTENAVEVFEVNGLEVNTDYIFSVRAESADGYSDESKVSNQIKTRSPVPNQPGKPACKAKAHDRITLSWSRPTEYFENIECYKISYSDNKKEKTKVTDGRVEEIVIDGLDPQKGYYFKVKAKSKFGDSLNSLSSDLIGTNPVRPVLKIIPHCKKLQDSPTIYHLSMTQSDTIEKKMYAKFEYGKATDGTTNKVLMIVGATGSGKSTLINGMVNYLLGVEWHDEFRLKLIDDKVQSQTKSVTKWISAYTFHKQDDFPLPYSLTIVDTPGFGDTEGIARDKEITSQIQEFFSLSGEQGIDHLDGIGFVTQGGLARLTPTQLYIFDSIFSIFGNDMKNNIFTMVTFADSADPPVIEAIKEAGIPYTDYFQFNNSALYTVNTNTFAKMFWDMGVKSFKNFFDKFEESQSVSLILTREVLDQREHLEVVIVGLHSQIQAGMLKINNLKQEQKILRENEEKIKANENFVYEVEEDCMEKVKLDHGTYVTICFKCNFTCHYPCSIPNDGNKYRCAAMNIPKNETTTCSVCPGKCGWQQHNNAEYRLVFKRKKVQKYYENVKKEYIEAKGGKVKVKNVIADMEEDIQTHFKIMLQNIIQAHSCIQRLDEIALKRHPLTDVGYIDLLIEAELQERKPGFKERVENYRVVREQAELIGKAKEMPQATLSIDETVKFWNKFVQVEPDVAISLPPVQIPHEENKQTSKVPKVFSKLRRK